MNHFTADNTEGYTTTDLIAMNDLLNNSMAGIDEDDPMYEQELKHRAEQVQGRYDNATNIPCNWDQR